MSSSVFAADPEKIEAALQKASKYTDSSFHLRESTSLEFAGAEALGVSTRYQNEIIFRSADQWRAKRELPFTKSLREVLKNGSDFHWIHPQNFKILPAEPTSNLFWLEILLSPLRVAERWTFANSDDDLSDLIKQLKKAENNTLKNADGDQIKAEFSKDGAVKLSLEGQLLADAKTPVRIQSVWEVSDIGKVTDAQLNESLMRSF